MCGLKRSSEGRGIEATAAAKRSPSFVFLTDRRLNFGQKFLLVSSSSALTAFGSFLTSGTVLSIARIANLRAVLS